MSEITKLYENAGIKPTKNWQSCLNCKLKTETRYDDWGSEYLTCNRLEMPEKCPDAKEYYPLFTAEKVLKVIVFFLNKGIKLDFSVEENTKISVENFKECIAQIGARYWQSLTSEEKQQVKGILE